MTLIASKPRASIAALQWAADRAGQSYGVSTQRLTAEDEKRIQHDYEGRMRQRKVEMSRRAAQRVGNDGTATDEFIITNENV